MLNKIEHIGIAVKDLDASLKKYEDVLGISAVDTEEIEVEGVINRVAFIPVKDTNIELVHTTGSSGLVADFLKEKGEGIHHIALEVDNLEKVFLELRNKGVQFLWNKIIPGSRGSRIAFFKPEEFNGVYIELIEKH